MPILEKSVSFLEQENERLRSEISELKNMIFSMSMNRSENKLESILQAIPMAVICADSEGVIQFSNRKFYDLFGYRAEDIATMDDWFRLAYPDKGYRNRIHDIRKECFARTSDDEKVIGPFEVAVACKDGSTRDVEVKSTRINGWNLAIFSDLSQARLSQIALKESEERFRAVFNGAKDGMLVTDIETKQFKLANRSIIEMLGYSEEELLRLSVHDIHPENTVGDIIRTITDAGHTHIPNHPALPVKRKNGEVFYAEVNSGPLIINGRQSLLGIFRDISDRKRYEEEILSEKDLSEAVLNSLPGVYYMFDKKGRFLRWNRHFEIATGYSRDEVGTLTPYDLFDGKDKPYIMERIQRVFETGESNAEASLVSKDGTRTPYYLTGCLFQIGGVDCLIGMGIDISRRKQAEKMQALGQLAGGVAHDFNNQLSAIMGFAEILSRNIDDVHLRNHAMMISKAASRSADLTKQLLAFARKGKYQSGPVDVHQIISDVIHVLKHSIDKRIVIKQSLTDRPATVLGDANQIQNALFNLALNARDAMPKGGDLVFSTARVFLDEPFCCDVSFEISPGPYLDIAVTDTGKGMDQAVQQRMFEPFFTTKDIGEGTGMGLAAVYGTIKNHKGAITVSSKPGKGSAFHVFLPIIDNVMITEGNASLLPHKHAEGMLIMVVDDEYMIRVVTSDILISLGYKVRVCKDGREAVEYYSNNWDRVHLIILDLMMPEMDGFETFGKLMEINSKAKILLSSGYSMDGQAQSLLQAGAIDFLQKPFTISQLTQKLSDAIV